MMKIRKLPVIFILFLIIFLGGKFVTEINKNENSNEIRAVNTEVYAGNLGTSNEGNDIKSENEDKDEEIQNKEEKAQEKDQNKEEKAQEKDQNKEEILEEAERDKKEKEINYLTMDVNEVKIPILMYHSISNDDSNNSLLVPISQFEEQIKWLSEEGFKPMLMEDVVQAFSTGKVPEKPVAITFDDGYADNYTEGYRILKKYNMKATFFIITDNIDVDGWYMNSNMLKEMSNNGMAIENHTSLHIEFTGISREDKSAIIEDGVNALKEKIGVESKFLCYPVGKYDDETIEVAKELGVKAAVTTENGIATLSDGLHSLKRVRISPMGIESFKSIFNT